MIQKEFVYKQKTENQLKIWFRSKKKDQHEFKSEEDFLEWYNNQDKHCYYCKLTEEESQKIVMNGWLKSNRFPKNGFPENGKLERGRIRGVWLEIDRKEPKGKYSRKNSVLACYFCNNDKSDVFKSAEEYNSFKEDRLGYLIKIIKKNE